MEEPEKKFFLQSIHIVWLAFYEKAKGRQYTRLALLLNLYDTVSDG